MLDSLDGTDVVAVRPRSVSFASGVEHLACMSLSPKGMLRWYARCCRTPIGNTTRDLKMAHVGLVHTCLESGDVSLERSFGPVRMRVNSASAAGKTPPNAPLTFASSIARFLAALIWNRMSGGYKDNPFFDVTTGRPIVQPHVVSPAERASLRGGA